eukprot:SAG22_NODE_7946_length_695_cov_307.907718_1_plen_119_part_01
MDDRGRGGGQRHVGRGEAQNGGVGVVAGLGGLINKDCLTPLHSFSFDACNRNKLHSPDKHHEKALFGVRVVHRRPAIHSFCGSLLALSLSSPRGSLGRESSVLQVALSPAWPSAGAQML